MRFQCDLGNRIHIECNNVHRLVIRYPQPHVQVTVPWQPVPVTE